MRKRKIRRTIGYSYMIGGTALLSGKLPSPIKEPIQIVATRGTEFVIPMVAVTGAKEVIGRLGKIKKRKRRLK